MASQAGKGRINARTPLQGTWPLLKTLIASRQNTVAMLQADVAESNKQLTETNSQLASLITAINQNKGSQNTTGSVQTSNIQTQPPSPNQTPVSSLTPIPTQDPIMTPTLTHPPMSPILAPVPTQNPAPPILTHDQSPAASSSAPITENTGNGNPRRNCRRLSRM